MKFFKHYILSTIINILVVFIIFSNSMNFVTKKHTIDSNNYVVESWFDEKDLKYYLDNKINESEYKNLHFYIIGRDIKTFHTWRDKLALLNSYGIEYTHVLPDRDGTDRNYKNILALNKFIDEDSSFTILTDRLHSQRSHFLAQKIFSEKDIGIEYFTRFNDNFDSPNYNASPWYQHSQSLKATIMEFIALLYSVAKY